MRIRPKKEKERKGEEKKDVCVEEKKIKKKMMNLEKLKKLSMFSETSPKYLTF